MSAGPALTGAGASDLKAELLALEERLLDPAVRAVPGQVRALLAPEFIDDEATS